MTPGRVVIYARQSKDDRGDRRAVTRQLDDARDLASRRGWTIVQEIIDNDVSASGRRPRPGFEQLLALVAAGEIDAVIAWDLSRLTRNRRDTVRLIEACQRGTYIALVRGSDLDMSTPAGRFAADMLAAIARQEIEQKGDRQRRAARQAAEEGRPWSRGQRAFGYERDGVTLRPAEAAAVAKAYEAVIAGTPLAQICRELTEAGHHTPQLGRAKLGADGQAASERKPGTWTAQTITPLLRNPRYMGMRGVLHEPPSGHGRRVWEIVGPATWPAIVDVNTWHAVQAILASPTRRRPAHDGVGLLTGIAQCAVCGDGTTLHRGGATRGQGAVYRCRAAYGHVARRAAPVDEYVTEHVLMRLEEDDARDLLYDERRPDLAELRVRIATLEQRLTTQAELHAAGDLTDGQLMAGSRRLRADLADLERQLTDASRLSVLGPLLAADDVRAAWAALPVERRRAVIDLLVTVVVAPAGQGRRTFDPATVRVDWR